MGDSSDHAGEKAARRFVVPPVVGLVGGEDEVAFGAGEGDVEEAFFFFEFEVSFGVVAGEFVFGHAGDENGVEFEAFGLVDGEDGDTGVVEGKEVEVPGECDSAGEVGEHVRRGAGGLVLVVEELDEASEVDDA